jgi:hypothetical protein
MGEIVREDNGEVNDDITSLNPGGWDYISHSFIWALEMMKRM